MAHLTFPVVFRSVAFREMSINRMLFQEQKNRSIYGVGFSSLNIILYFLFISLSKKKQLGCFSRLFFRKIESEGVFRGARLDTSLLGRVILFSKKKTLERDPELCSPRIAFMCLDGTSGRALSRFLSFSFNSTKNGELPRTNANHRARALSPLRRSSIAKSTLLFFFLHAFKSRELRHRNF